jgi:D-glucosaminate-6-phosphate ammonia-lyase
MHQTDFELLNLVGMVEGNEIKLRSDYRVPGNSLIYLFSAKIENEKLTGSIYLGEYLNASVYRKPYPVQQQKKKDHHSGRAAAGHLKMA